MATASFSKDGGRERAFKIKLIMQRTILNFHSAVMQETSYRGTFFHCQQRITFVGAHTKLFLVSTFPTCSKLHVNNPLSVRVHFFASRLASVLHVSGQRKDENNEKTRSMMGCTLLARLCTRAADSLLAGVVHHLH